jgi:hypothetical protein
MAAGRQTAADKLPPYGPPLFRVPGAGHVGVLQVVGRRGTGEYSGLARVRSVQLGEEIAVGLLRRR